MRTVILALATAIAIAAANQAQAAVSYDTAGSTYSQNFNGLPTGTNPHNGRTIQTNGAAQIQNGNAPFPGGWKDDAVTDDTYLGLPGWYLWHAANFPTSGGANGHAHFRYGGGNATSGTGFFLFSHPIGAEKALGLYINNNFFLNEPAYIGLQLTNDTGKTLDSFTITYDGEQYREGANADRAGFDLQWSLAATAANWQSSTPDEGFYDGVSGVDYGEFPESFLSPVNEGVLAYFVGNDNRVADISHTVSGINWAPGEELWIRWRYGTVTVFDGIAIDNVRFTASASSEGLPGDFNDDGVVDGNDFLVWQRGETTPALSPETLQLWKDNFGTGGDAQAAVGAVPEPAAATLAVVGMGVLSLIRRRK